MIEYFYEGDYKLETTDNYTDWINKVVSSEERLLGTINYIFCNDDYLLSINQKHLDHNTFTDIITFDYSLGMVISGDVFISTERVEENAKNFNVPFQEELLRVMVHGLLHMFGYNDKTDEERIVMRTKEEEKIKMFHVEQS
ncbi:MAG: rRNA maturation RNase YbeY [Maribacter sp.]|nr:rRNA maturation RNase YbeY [Maribacter sp.]